ncbi:MAG TPA: cation:proton antiporter [Thermoplasmata archaeon]|nr:cation:proton antiporter [Thermoplasmata archaeon]
MVDANSIMFEVGVIAAVGFLGAAVASRARISVVIGYIVAGMLIGPNIHLNLFGVAYNGLLLDTEFVQSISQLGLVLLLFFVGLEFSIAKLRRTKEAAAILAVTNLAVDMFAGFVIGTWLGWPLIDTIFMAGVISMSSSAIAAKALIDLKRLGNAETEFILGMVILESFLAMIILTLVNGVVISSDGAPLNPLALFAGIGIFLGFFTFLAAVVIPHTVKTFERIKSDELFILFALAVVFLSAALAQAFRVPAIIGAFFIGMVFADTKLAQRLKTKMESLRDAFVAMFFLSFGMLIDPSSLPAVLPMLLIAVPLILMSDLFLTASLAYMIGFSARAATAIGTSFVARNEEAVLYATVGTRAISNNPNLSNNYAGTYLTPFTGILCIVMSSLAPLLMVRSDRLARFFSRHLPKSITFGAELVKRTLRTVVMPSMLPIYRKRKLLQATLILYSAWIIDLTITHDLAHAVLAVMAPLVIYAVYGAARRTFQEPVRHTNYGVNGGPFSRSTIESFVLRIVVGTLVTIALVAILWQYYWPATLAILYTYFLAVVFSMKVVYRRLGLGMGRRRRPLRILRGVPTTRRGRPSTNGFGRR